LVLEFLVDAPEFSEIDEYRLFYETQAEILFDALYSVLPGGTFDRLLLLMLQAKASLLRAPLFGDNENESQ